MFVPPHLNLLTSFLSFNKASPFVSFTKMLMTLLVLITAALVCIDGKLCRIREKEVVTKNLLKGRQCRTVQLLKGRIHTIEPDAFKDLVKLRGIEVSKNELSEIAPDMFKDLTSLKRLSIRENMICIVVDGTFKYLVSLEFLYLTKTCLKRLNKGSFTGLSSLVMLDLRDNNITFVAHGAFQDLFSLEKLYLQDNFLKEHHQDIFLGLTSLFILKLSENKLEALQKGSFRHLVFLDCLYLDNNEIKSICKDSFIGLKSLKTLELGENRIRQLLNRTFEHLVALKNLCLEKNGLTMINEDSFLGLKFLNTLHLGTNNISYLLQGTFRHLVSLEKLIIRRNIITELNANLFLETRFLRELNAAVNLIHKLTSLNLESLTQLAFSSNRFHKVTRMMFKNMKYLTGLLLSNNCIQKIENGSFSHLQNLKKLGLGYNQIKYIDKFLFKQLISLEELYLGKNKIEEIETGAFTDLIFLKKMYLYDNKITIINKEIMQGLASVEHLDLSENDIHVVERSSFAIFVLLSEKELKIDLSYNNFTELSWDIYLNSSLSFQKNYAFQQRITLLFEQVPFECTINLCWLKQSQWKGITKLTKDLWENMYHNDYLDNKCDEELEGICPDKETWCMDENTTTCEEKCLKMKNRYTGGKLIIHKDFCPFQYFCECSCSGNCTRKCASQGKISASKSVDIFGCVICRCECEETNCWKICKGSDFQVINNTFGCPKCKCGCPLEDCNRKCSSNKIGMIKLNRNGCKVCNGCRTKPNDDLHQGSNSFVNGQVLPALFSLCMLSLLVSMCIMFHCKSPNLKPFDITHTWTCNCRRKREDAEKLCNDSYEDSLFTTLTHSLSPQFAQEVQRNWWEPNSLCFQHLLGRGEFGIVWSGTFQSAPGSKCQVAIKVVRAEFKDVWTVETNWNSNNELMPHFEKRRVELELDNQLVEDFLKEALVMKRFNHPNVLNMLGISAHEGKPCVILPLMSNGDLKKYLNTKKSSLTVQDLVAFSLGVAKGMTHLAEQKFVHCDLAARNCMLNENLVVKISDFGLTKDMCEEEYYREEDKSKPLPMRWMSPEAIEHRKFSLQSDVWSFGVVLWEIFSYGELPYKGIENMDILKFLMTGQRLEKPVICPDYMHDIMLECWNDDSRERPEFSKILDKLNSFADVVADYLDVREEPTSDEQSECPPAEIMF